MSYKKKITILGATGSIGKSAADVILSAPERFDVQCVTANTNAELLAAQAVKLKAKRAVIADETKYDLLKSKLDGTGIETAAGAQALEGAASEPADLILAGIVGIAGLKPIMKAIEQGACVAIANKEPLVAAGPLVMAAAKKYGTTLLPVDSEHNAVFQVFDFERPEGIEKITLTASGGPFLNRTSEEMAKATPEQAIAHPNWSMGRKISVDSATMMNKALEIIEAHYLFNIEPNKIDVLIHPQSVIHSMVHYKDGSVLAQMGASDMRTPIAHVLAWPERMETPGQKLDLTQVNKLTFEAPDFKQFPALQRAYKCLERGLYACVALNAANEVAVEAFLTNNIGFLDIMDCIDHILGKTKSAKLDTITDIIEFDENIRAETRDFIANGVTKKAAQAS
ncbi:MAG: 1-deoxy-D-xylulose 5-phosphate reductoisomerase [Micavibrio sp.]|nr:MAG: 1-deoxy-D-xylulose 5-phosphate reductoisomerase [Micavibrio sp.]